MGIFRIHKTIKRKKVDGFLFNDTIGIIYDYEIYQTNACVPKTSSGLSSPGRVEEAQRQALKALESSGGSAPMA